MDNWFKSKWFVRIVSLAFAISLYIFVTVEVDDSKDDSRIFPGISQETQTLDDVPVEIKIDSDRYVVSGVPEFVSVTLEGANAVITPKIRQRNFSVFVDLEGLEEGEHTVEVDYENVPEEISVYIEPKTIDVYIEERSSESFPINVDIVNEDQLPTGYELGEPTVNPETVTITSSKNVIDQIAMVKVFVDVAGLTEPINNRELPINVYDSQGNELNVRIEPENTVLSLSVDNPNKTVPLEVTTENELPVGYKLTSIEAEMDEVQVFATSDVLAGIEQISTKPIDLSEIKESGKLKVPLNLGEDVVSDVEEVDVAVEIEQTKEVEEVAIQIEGAEEGNIAFLNPSSPVMRVTAIGNEKDVKGVEAEDIQVLINASGLDAGEHQVPVSISGPANINYRGEYEEVTIEVT